MLKSSTPRSSAAFAATSAPSRCTGMSHTLAAMPDSAQIFRNSGVGRSKKDPWLNTSGSGRTLFVTFRQLRFFGGRGPRSEHVVATGNVDTFAGEVAGVVGGEE